jgi:hypothetical protein
VVTPLVLGAEPQVETFKIIPNPANTKFSIEGPPLETLFKLFDSSGRLWLETKNREIDVSSFSTGLYFLHAEGYSPAKVQITH